MWDGRRRVWKPILWFLGGQSARVLQRDQRPRWRFSQSVARLQSHQMSRDSRASGWRVHVSYSTSVSVAGSVCRSVADLTVRLN